MHNLHLVVTLFLVANNNLVNYEPLFIVMGTTACIINSCFCCRNISIKLTQLAETPGHPLVYNLPQLQIGPHQGHHLGHDPHQLLCHRVRHRHHSHPHYSPAWHIIVCGPAAVLCQSQTQTTPRKGGWSPQSSVCNEEVLNLFTDISEQLEAEQSPGESEEKLVGVK
jgi:hypothetical protein